MSALETIEGYAQLTESMARELTDTIRQTVAIVDSQITRAYFGRAWSALGYESWDEYCETEFDGARVRLPREERTMIVGSLRDAGLSIRAIAAATGLGRGTVERELTPVPNGTPAVTGIDGKTYPATKPIVPDAVLAPGTRDQQREADRREAVARHARQLERLVSLWPYLDNFADDPTRPDVLALLTEHDRRLLDLIEGAVAGRPVYHQEDAA